MYLVKTPRVIQKLFPNFHWRGAAERAGAPVLYLTFDDGPIPEVTPWVLEQLAAYDATATFFCVGNNIRKHPALLRRVREAGHAVGNHTMHHLDGWKSDNIPYFHDIRHCAKLTRSELFRPPYGRLRPSQAQFLQRHYEIVMWDVLSGDFDPELDGRDCAQNVIRNAGPGSIVVFHDSLKAAAKLREALPVVLEDFAARGYVFRALTPAILTRRSGSVADPRLETA